MFDGFANLWSPLIRTCRLGRQPLQVQIAGEKIVLFRRPEGEVAALLDRCPHRGARLSLGTVTPDGCIECPFHGWQFDFTGANRLVPLAPEANRSELGATPIPVREIGDFIWIYTAPGLIAPREPNVPVSLSDPKLARSHVERVWHVHWSRVMENMLDAPHLPFVHRRSIGRTYRKHMSPSSRMDITWEDTPWGGRTQANLTSDRSGGFIEYFKPNIMVLHIAIPGRHLRIHALVVPVDQASTRLTITASRDFLRARILNPIFSRMNARIADEDRAVVESMDPAEVPHPSREHSVATDRATLQFRRYYLEVLKPSKIIPD